MALEIQQNHVLGRIALRDRAPRNPILSSCKGFEKGREGERVLQIGSVSMVTLRMDDYSWANNSFSTTKIRKNTETALIIDRLQVYEADRKLNVYAGSLCALCGLCGNFAPIYSVV